MVATVVDSDDEAAEADVSLGELLFSGELVDSLAGRVWSVSFWSAGFSEVALLVSLGLLTAAAAVVGRPRPDAPRAEPPRPIDRLGNDGRPRNEFNRLDESDPDAEAAEGAEVLVV